LLFSFAIPSSGEAIDFRIPELQIEEFSYEFNENHDVYVQNEQFHRLIDETFSFLPATMDQTIFFEENIDHGNQFEGISQYLNNSLVESDQKMEYKRNYYNLFDNETTSVDKIFLETGRSYLFTFEVSSGNIYSPMFFEFLFSQVSGGTGFDLDIQVVDPLGNTDLINNLQTTKDVTQLVPFIPKTNGTHMFALTTNTNVVLSGMNVNLSPEIIDLTSGYSERIQGATTIGKFFKLDSENRTNIVDTSSIVFQKEYYIDLVNVITFGDFVEYTFGRETGGLLGGGTPIPNDDIFWTLVVSPADPADVLVQKAKTDEIYSAGIDLEITLTSQKTPILSLPLNQNFDTDIIDSYSKDNPERIYQFESSETLLIGLNSSTANPNDQIQFLPNDPDMTAIIVTPRDNDVLNDMTDDFIILPGGVYTVFVPKEETYHITTLSLDTLNIDQTETLSTTFGDNHYFELPSGVFTQDFLNFTYLDRSNESISFDYTLYDARGAQIDSNTIDFTHYYFDDDPSPSIDLVLDLFNQTYITGGINFEGAYLKLAVTGNSKYNSTTGERLYADMTNITSQIRISRLNEFKINQQLYPQDLYYFDTLEGSINHPFLAGNDTVINYFDLVTKENSVYRITIDVTNRTLKDFNIDLGNNLWFKNLDQLNPVNISDFNHYILSIEFVSTIPVFMGMILTIGDEDFNGTYTITLEEFTYEEIGVIILPELNINDLTKILAHDDDESTIFSNPLFLTAVIGGIGIITFTVLFLKRKGKI
jgi:hypothetical protein